jgi:hypothetical protein
MIYFLDFCYSLFRTTLIDSQGHGDKEKKNHSGQNECRT